MKFKGYLAHDDYAPENSDRARLDFLSLHPRSVKNLKAGVITAGIDAWQPGLRQGIDAAMEKLRRELRTGDQTRARPRF